MAMCDQPSWAFRNPEAHEKNQAGQTGANQESESPAEIRIDHLRIEQDQRAERSDGRSDPEAAVDHEVVPSAHACRNELLNGGVDSGIFPAYPRAGQESKEREARDVPGKCRGRGRRQIDGKRQKEELLAAESIGQPAEKNCTEHSSGKIGAARKPDVGIRDSKRWAF